MGAARVVCQAQSGHEVDNEDPPDNPAQPLAHAEQPAGQRGGSTAVTSPSWRVSSGVMASDESLLPLAEVTDRLRIRGQHYVGVKPIPVERIIGSVDRSVDVDRLFRPRRSTLLHRLQSLRNAFPDGMVPAITAYEVGGMYFVVDGHHRVALAHELQMEYLDADVTALTTSHALTSDVDVRQLIHTEQHRIFKERSGLLVRHPEAKILFSRPTGYGQILDLVEAHAYQMSVRV